MTKRYHTMTAEEQFEAYEQSKSQLVWDPQHPAADENGYRPLDQSCVLVLPQVVKDFLDHKLSFKPVPDQETDPVKLGLREIDRLNDQITYATQELAREVQQLQQRLNATPFPFKCSHCDRRFWNQVDLNLHLSTTNHK